MKSNRTLLAFFGMMVFVANADSVWAYYSPEMGRFISRDPIEYDAGDENLYRYVSNSSTLALDPMGLQLECCDNLPQPSCRPIIQRYIARSLLSGNLRNRSGKHGMGVPNVFNHPFINEIMKSLRESLEKQICDPDNNNSDFGKGDRYAFPEQSVPSFEWLINEFSLSYTASVNPGSEENCYDVKITWQFEDHIDAKTFETLRKESIGKIRNIQDMVEGTLRNCLQYPMNSDFWVSEKKTDSFTHCCCKK